ncbi:hypothetical protein CAPTEDRAFT_128195 [Capitella teleta]|uniref:Uncharacterized protein n=1 Tax=Capitella teleta TaxID=283909 RepID=R7V7M9_CAPTE|nr:hypothetical protein CAPTEDRAFT_128195 [Capitella teleta]|eukprot:ELU14863.1 hypothetical protein CAPTEDRAFT_128195 [Capitella teleta]
MRNDICNHLIELEEELSRYFPDKEKEEESFYSSVRYSFSPLNYVEDLKNAIQDYFFELQNDSTSEAKFKCEDLATFWCSLSELYQKKSKIARGYLLPFTSTYK